MMDFRMDTFLAVCEHMNYTRAAQALHITQPAVSQHIRYLEKHYQVKLFCCEGKQVGLTPGGEHLLRAATALKNDEHFLREQLIHASQGSPALKFGTTITIGESVISRPLAAYIKRHPGTGISLVIQNTNELLHKLKAGEIRFALVEGYYDHKEYDSLIYRTEPFVPVCALGHRFVREPKTLKDLLGEALLVREPGSGTRDILEKALVTRNLGLQDFGRMIEIGSMHVILQLLKMDMGISFLYRRAVEEELRTGELRELKLQDFQMEHDFAFIWNRGSIYGDEYRNICREMQQA
ncbi:MAG: LysR family transcriptional regulator [Clostridium sp.]|nr:LysR family transcriptional regulator [Clostridium sp.]